MKKKIVSIILIISFILVFSSISVFADTNGYINVWNSDGSVRQQYIVIPNLNDINYIDIDFMYVPLWRDGQVYDFCNALNAFCYYRDGTTRNFTLYGDLNIIDTGYSDMPNREYPLCNRDLDIFSNEQSFFSDVFGYYFEDVLKAFVYCQDVLGIPYTYTYSLQNYSSGFTYYHHSYTQVNFTNNYLNFYYCDYYDYGYSLSDDNGDLFTDLLYPGFVDVYFREHGDDIAFVTNYVDTSFSHPQYTFEKGNYIGVKEDPNASSFMLFEDFTYYRYFSYYLIGNDLAEYFSRYFGTDIKLELVSSNSGGEDTPAPEEPDQGPIINESNQITDWIKGDAWGAQQRVDHFDSAMKDLNSLNKPIYNSSDVELSNGDIESINQFGVLMTPIFDNSFIAIRMILLVLTFAFVSYVLFGKK